MFSLVIPSDYNIRVKSIYDIYDWIDQVKIKAKKHGIKKNQLIKRNKEIALCIPTLKCRIIGVHISLGLAYFLKPNKRGGVNKRGVWPNDQKSRQISKNKRLVTKILLFALVR